MSTRAIECMVTAGMELSNHAALARREPCPWLVTPGNGGGLVMARDPQGRLYEIRIKQLAGPL